MAIITKDIRPPLRSVAAKQPVTFHPIPQDSTYTDTEALRLRVIAQSLLSVGGQRAEMPATREEAEAIIANSKNRLL